MLKQENLQPELFTQSSDNGQYQLRAHRNPFIFRIRGYEKAVLLIMALVLACIVSFSIGVERGKQSGLAKNSGFLQDSYTIQVAAFKNRGLALKEAQLLAKKGLAPLVFAKGNYIILCVGKFSNQESARPLLDTLQKTYAGCRIRRL